MACGTAAVADEARELIATVNYPGALGIDARNERLDLESAAPRNNAVEPGRTCYRPVLARPVPGSSPPLQA
jgi:hypothetical protein